MGQSPSSATCRDHPTNAYWNNASNPNLPVQSVVNADLLTAFFTYAVVGAIASLFNIVCILVFLTKKEHRQKYLFYTVLVFGNLFNTLFMLISGILRRQMIITNRFQQVRSSFECLLQPGPHLQVVGGQLPALILLIINVERFIAVFRPVYYKSKVSPRIRMRVAIGCLVVVLISLLVGYVAAYFSTYCSNYFCSVTGVYRFAYSNYNTAVVILLPIFALILNIITYIGAKSKLKVTALMKKELNRIRVALVITSVNVVLIAFPNFLMWTGYMALITYNQVYLAYVYIFFCCNSITDLFVYAILKRDFRNQLLMLISFGVMKAQITTINGVVPNNWVGTRRQVTSTNNTVGTK